MVRIQLDKIGSEGQLYSFELDAKDLPLKIIDSNLVGKVRFEGRVDRSQKSIILKGKIVGQLLMTCSRCLKNFDSPLATEFKSVYMLEPELEKEEIDLLGAELDMSHLTGDSLDLNESIREQILLSLPIKSLCKENCLGLCPQCGKNRNTNPCNCKPPVDPRLAGLEKLLKDKGKEES